jgi:hypothetical protein
MSEADRSAREAGADAIDVAAGIAPVLVFWGLSCLVFPRVSLYAKVFGNDLPWPAHIVVHYHGYGFVLGLLVVAVWRLWPWPETSGRAALAFGFVLTTALFVGSVYALVVVASIQCAC